MTLGEIDERIADGDVADAGKILREQSVLRDVKRIEQAMPRRQIQMMSRDTLDVVQCEMCLLHCLPDQAARPEEVLRCQARFAICQYPRTLGGRGSE